MKKTLYLTLFFAASVTASAQQVFDARGWKYLSPETKWVEKTMKDMSLEERIAQLMVVRVPLNMDDKQAKEFSDRMNGYGVGGVRFFVGTAERQASMTRLFQEDAKVPLLVCIDGEWGLGMRLKDMYSFPRNARFGMLPQEKDSLVYRMGEEIGRQCREMGIHITLPRWWISTPIRRIPSLVPVRSVPTASVLPSWASCMPLANRARG